MGRLPFNPDETRGPGSDPADVRPARRDRKRFSRLSDAQQLTVSQLCEVIKTTLEERVASPLRVIGEVSNYNAREHWYFSLKDDSSVISCVAWASSARKFNFTPKEGDEIVATGHVSHFAPQGKTQLYVTKLEPVGSGALELEFRRMCEELRRLGYFDPERKKPLPLFPRKVAIITSASGAALQDVIATAAHRCKAVGFVVIDVRVQGEGASDQIAHAIEWVDQHHARLGIDAILVTRGGGSIEDLWAFNERIVADAAYTCSLPLVAAIGHESDTTLIELIADVRASTPTQAAMRLVPDGAELARQLAHASQRLNFLLRRSVERQRDRLASLTRHVVLRDPLSVIRPSRERSEAGNAALQKAIRNRVLEGRYWLERLSGRLESLRPVTLVTRKHQRLAVLEDRLSRAISRDIQRRLEHVQDRACAMDAVTKLRITRHAERLASHERQLAAVDPRQVLQRGYSLTTAADGSLIRSIADVRLGDQLITNVADGSLTSTVSSARERAVRRKRGGGALSEPAAEQLDLFDSPDR